MKTTVSNYKYIDKSTDVIFREEDTFKVLHLRNLKADAKKTYCDLSCNYIQLFFALSGNAVTAFNFEHCAVNMPENSSNMVYFKDDQMKLYFQLEPNAELIVILISIDYFHSLFSFDGNFLINYGNFVVGKPIIEQKNISKHVKLVLNQLISSPISPSLKQMYTKGKIYELLSLYFGTFSEENEEHCPYIANEETVSKIKRVKDIIIEEMNDPPSLSELAKLVGLNIKKLKTEFKEFYGMPVFAFLLNYKMELSKTMLHENQMNVNQIAAYLGYSTSSHFIAAFKRKFGITPKQFSKI